MSHVSPYRRTDQGFNPSLMTNVSSLGCGEESRTIEANYERFLNDFKEPIFRRQQDLATKFNSLKLKWEEETLHLSSVTQIAMHPAYQQIIGMGEKALPFIMSELSDKPGLWFWALKAITGEDPIPAKMRGKTKAMAETWILWWTRNRARYAA